jgi:TolB-like protein
MSDESENARHAVPTSQVFSILLTHIDNDDTMNSPLAPPAKTHLFRICIFALMCCSVYSTATAEFQKTKIAVLDFEPIGEKLDTSDMGAILSEWFITGLVKSGRFDVVERAVLKKIVAEQGLSATGRIDENSAGKLGKILGVKVIIAGSVLKNKGVIAMNSRVISVENGSIIASEDIRGGADGDLHALVSDLTGKIMRSFPLTGYVVRRNERSVVIDLGLDSGLAPGTEFIAYREGEVIIHPKTGEVLDVEQIETGRLRIDRISKNVAEGAIVSEQPGGIQSGHLVKSVQKK